MCCPALLAACGNHSGEAEHDSGIGLKLFGFIAEPVFGFIPESLDRRGRSSIVISSMAQGASGGEPKPRGQWLPPVSKRRGPNRGDLCNAALASLSIGDSTGTE